ncbi:cryptochrome/photolyase family protein [Sinomonas terrae]|uniref:DNA photolyase family protein n=1 Tax=Sinomonas terrae TaxID=2908838 RepID=A0ABS9U6G6_9MICC|nr:deoxyribodipyrimidine photo-lyase [Sinomonas terrae]MCH6472297.1 DNA photolyase family protein [Sinomonas terrae]
MSSPSVVWFRDDLRTADNPALHAAMDAGPTFALYVLDEESPGIRPLGGAARWWLHYALVALREELGRIGVPLVLRRGPAAAVVPAVAAEAGAGGLFWNRRYGAGERRADAAVKQIARSSGRRAESHQASLLHEPWELTTRQGGPYKVFTPFWKELSSREFRHPLPAPEGQRAPEETPRGDSLEQWGLLPGDPDWSGPLTEAWTPGPHAAHELLEEFADAALTDYSEDRERPGLAGTSRLSPYLRWGHVSPFEVWHAIGRRRREAPEGSAAFASELGWREFAWHQLYHHPDLATVNLRREFDAYPWWSAGDGGSMGDGGEQAALLARWRRGTTGLPLVDAGQRELWATGWMHNRVRMVSASLLVKNLGIDWRLGEQWFWDTLVDADPASNPFNWQWAAGCGADASPFFRIFNPLTQEKVHDPDGTYTRRWIPELGTPEYPEACVDLKKSRAAALEAFRSLPRNGSSSGRP